MIVEYPNFLTDDECNLLIALGESGQLNPGKVTNNTIGYRKAKVRWFNDSPIVEKIKNEVAKLSGIPLENQEQFHFVKYTDGGEYKPHTDGKNRIKTALIYLNDGFIGGETFFVNLNRTIRPEIGKLVIWNNLTESGERDENSLHAGLPVEFGTKYIGVIWIKK